MQKRIIFAIPIGALLFIGHLFSRLPFNPFVPYLTQSLNPLQPPLWTACILGLLHDLILPSPRLGAFSLAYVLSTALIAALLRKISSTGSSIFMKSLISLFLTLFIEVLAQGIIALLGVPARETSFGLHTYIVLPIGTFLLSLALNAITLRRSAPRYE